MDKELYSKLKELKIEDYIWIIYIGIILASWYANSLERNYYINNDNHSKEKYRHIMIMIFTILLIVYAYFFKSSFDDLKKIRFTDNNKKKTLVYLSFLASLLIFLSGAIFLYIAYEDHDLNVEIAFN